MHLKDGYGTGLDRSQVCFDSTKTVVVMITDTCECYLLSNVANSLQCSFDLHDLWRFSGLTCQHSQ
jgi:hypothetical protein